MEEPIKVLYFVDRMLRGGIQSLVMNWVSKFDNTKVKVDFLLLDDGKKYELEDTLKEYGCNVFKLKGIWIRKPLDFIKESKALNTFFKEHSDYKIIHMHSTSKNYMVMKYAKKYGIPIRIAHAHATDFQTNSKAKKIFGNILKSKLIKYSTDFFACSKEAGMWLFGDDIVNSDHFQVIHNGVDVEKFKYNENDRTIIRKKYGVKDDEILIGHVGRFTEVKNHKFMADIMKKIIEKNNKYKIMFIGEGILKDEIIEEVKKYNLKEYVIFAGFQSEVEKYMSAFDIFILPSIYEGLGLVLVEAQANGLPCIATKNTIPNEVQINPNFKFIDLEIQKWVDEILKSSLKRLDNRDYITKSGYDIEETIDKLTQFYIK